jgi:8-oxo-dGTP pyrophosphatase MutT (NUDIX family)
MAAAVLILLFPRRGRISFLLTRRPHFLSTHAGQVALPGGAYEPGDADLWDTALREAREELGIVTRGVRRLGRVESVPVSVTGYVVTPFVGWSPCALEIHPEPSEVAEVIEVALDELLEPGAIREEAWILHGSARQVAFFQLGDTQVWGATARILTLFCRRLNVTFGTDGLEPGSVRPFA